MRTILKYRLYILGVMILIGIGYLVFKNKPTGELKTDIQSSFEPDIYFAQVIQVGGVGSDIYTNKAYYIGDGTTHQEGFPNTLDKDSYAPVSFNSVSSLMYLNCKDGYEATVMPSSTTDKHPFSAGEDKQGDSIGFSIEIKEQIKNELTIKCQKI